ncbi:MAG TPA: primosomal protein N' [Gammaproteobacteria bacterium]|nr:primosomal protein N' [Gammaproteobacteria bacterium]
MKRTPLILKVAVPSPLYRDFDYLPPPDADLNALQPGMRLAVPFGRQELTGVLLDTADGSELPRAKLKAARRLLDDTPVVPPEMLALARWAADYYRHPIGEVVQTLLPVALRQGKAAARAATPLWRLNAVGRDADPGELVRAPRQRALHALLLRHPAGLEPSAIADELPAPAAALRALAKRGWVEDAVRVEGPAHVEIPLPAIAGRTDLNPAQQAAVGEITSALGGYKAFLLDGVTGSGKTEVYLAAIAATVASGRQALVLIPEINLTPQTLARFRARFGQVAAFHSGLSDGERLATWLAARDGSAPVIVGTRSAAWLPLKSPGLFVVDEEHDASYKQQEGFRYSARDLTVVRAQRARVPVILGSATPSLESLHNAALGRYIHLQLPERAGVARHPVMKLLDIRSRRLVEGLSDLLLDAVKRHLASGGQVLLFLNRRGYAPTLMCHDCGAPEQCKRCDARMTLHGHHRLVCHHCGAERPVPKQCPHCGSQSFGAFGQGTERIETALAELFPDAGVARIDRDSTRRKGSMERLLDEVQRGERRLLVGTQMLAKGHDFPNVTLVGVLDADQGLFSSDFRASERMAQLIIQVAGRAGRAEKAGEVLIQTHQPDHPLLNHLVREGYGSFAAAALQERRSSDLPPYAALALLRAESPGLAPPTAFLEAARDVLARRRIPGVSLLGPAPAPMERRAGRYRAHLLLQAGQRAPLQKLLAVALPELDELKQARKVRWSVDVDPVNLD